MVAITRPETPFFDGGEITGGISKVGPAPPEGGAMGGWSEVAPSGLVGTDGTSVGNASKGERVGGKLF